MLVNTAVDTSKMSIRDSSGHEELFTKRLDGLRTRALVEKLEKTKRHKAAEALESDGIVLRGESVPMAQHYLVEGKH